MNSTHTSEPERLNLTKVPESPGLPGLQQIVSRDALDKVLTRLTCGIAMIGVIHDTLLNGSCDAGSYTDAIYGTLLFLYDVESKFHEVLDAAKPVS